MKKTALAIVLVSALLLSSAELLRTTEANPYWIYAHVDPVPGTIPPAISIYNPRNDTGYSSSSITVSLYITEAELAGWHCNIEYVEYSIDGRTVELYPFWQRVEPGEEVEPKYIPSAIDFPLSSLTLGMHRLTVKAGVAVLRGEPLEVFFLDCNSTVFFTVDNADYSLIPSPTPSPSPSPSLSPSPELPATPKPTATPEPTLQPANSPATQIFLATVGIAVVCGGMFVYFKKHQRNRNS